MNTITIDTFHVQIREKDIDAFVSAFAREDETPQEAIERDHAQASELAHAATRTMVYEAVEALTGKPMPPAPREPDAVREAMAALWPA